MENLKQKEFLELYEPIHTNFCRFCRTISGNLPDAEDLVNDAIIVAYSGLGKIKDKTAFKSYLFSIASNLNKMRFRRKKFKVEFNENEAKQLIDQNSDPEQLTGFKIIYEKMMSLPSKYKETLTLFYISDLTINEIQTIQGGSISSVKQRLKRGREKLLKLLETQNQVDLAILFLTI